MRIVNNKLSELFIQAEIKSDSVPCVIRLSGAVYEGFALPAKRLGLPTELFMSGYLRWVFSLPVLNPELDDADRIWSVFENVGATTDTIRDGTTAEGEKQEVVLSVPSAVQRQFNAAASGVETTGEHLLTGYLEAIFGVEGSTSFERWLTFIHGVTGRIYPLAGFFRPPEL